MEIKQKLGNEAILELDKTAFLSSRKTPKVLIPILEEWVKGLSADDGCMICGNHSLAEKKIFSLMLQYKLPVILVLAEGMKDVWNDDIKAALDEGRLLIVTHCGEEVRRVSSRSAFDRNILMMSLADNIVVGYCDKCGNLERALAGFDNVTYILTDQGDDPDRYIDPVELLGREQTGHTSMAFDPWTRSVETADGTITLGFDGKGEDRFVWIKQMGKYEETGSLSGRICLGCAEFVKFCDVLKKAFFCLEIGKGTGPDVYVASASGDITFDMIYEEGREMLVVRQTKDLKSMGMRRQAVVVDKSDALLFYDVLLEAGRHFSEKWP